MSKDLINDQEKERAVILYDSVYGNTKKVAMALSRGLEAGGFTVDCNSIQNFNIDDIWAYDVIGLGAPTHFRRPSKQMRRFLSRFKRLLLSGKKGFAFETKARIFFAGSAGNRIYQTLERMNVRVLSPVVSGIVLNREGPLEGDTLSKMEKVGIEISEHYWRL